MTQIEEIKEIRNLMERSSRFLSLSGFSGIIAGLAALAGSAFAYWYLDKMLMFNSENPFGFIADPLLVLLTDALIVFSIALFAVFYFSWRKSKKQDLVFWSKTSKRLLLHFIIPLFAGGIFCLFLIYYQYYLMLIPAMLVFYGLALVNASKYTYDDTLYFGISEILLGLFSAFFAFYSIWIWAFGFGILHIIYGIVIYFKYDYGTPRKQAE